MTTILIALIALQFVNLVLLVLVLRLAQHAVMWGQVNSEAISHYGAISTAQLRKIVG